MKIFDYLGLRQRVIQYIRRFGIILLINIFIFSLKFSIEDIVGGISAIEIFEDIERQTRPLAVIQDKILKSKTTLREDNNCCIWLEPLRKGSLQLQIGCLHMFHFKWIKDWATRENTWPEWRQPINVQF